MTVPNLMSLDQSWPRSLSNNIAQLEPRHQEEIKPIPTRILANEKKCTMNIHSLEQSEHSLQGLCLPSTSQVLQTRLKRMHSGTNQEFTVHDSITGTHPHASHFASLHIVHWAGTWLRFGTFWSSGQSHQGFLSSVGAWAQMHRSPRKSSPCSGNVQVHLPQSSELPSPHSGLS